MHKSLDHLPPGKRRELTHVVDVLRTKFAEATSARKAPRLRDGRLLKIVLFGSYARGDWIDDPVGRYFSDFDLVVVVDHEDLTDNEFWQGAVTQILDDTASGEKLSTPVNFIVHTLDDVNDKLRLGRYFFADILREGITLHSEPGSDFVKLRPLPPAVARLEAQKHYEEWVDGAGKFLETADWHRSKGWQKLAAFDLHQTVERLYHCVLLVMTLYSPKSHNLVFLRTQCERIAPELAEAWPHADKFERRCFELLRAAYVKARYSPHYTITDEELGWLTDRVVVLQGLVKTVCEARLEALAQEADEAI